MRSSRLTLRDRCAVWAGELAGAVARALGRGVGVQIAGRVTYTLSPTIPSRLAADRRVVLVSATNGKTTITGMLAAALRANGRTVAANESGANLIHGLTNALAANPHSDYAVLETDEATLNTAVMLIRPALVLLGELSRDQLDRHHEVRAVAQRWRETFAAQAPPIVAPSNDPNVVWSVPDGVATWVDLDVTSTIDAAACPECARLLHRVGAADWWCDCGLRRPHPAARQRGGVVELAQREYHCSTALEGRWQQANAALAIVALDQLGELTDAAVAAIAAVASVGGRPQTLPVAGGRRARFVMTKNPAGWGALIDDLADSEASVVVAQNDESPDGRDPSWLWDVPFERLAPRRVAAAGTRRLDVATRLGAAGLDVVAIDADATVAAAALPRDTELVIGASYSAFHRLMRNARSAHS